MLAVAAAACGKKGPPLAPIVRVPAAVSTLEARQLGSEIFITLTVPDANIDGTKPADVDRIEIYGYTGRESPGARILAGATLVATIPVEPVRRDESGRPLPPALNAVPSGALQGATVTVRDSLTADEIEPRPLPPPPVRRGAPPPLPPLTTDPTGPPPPVQRFYSAIGFSDRDRTSPGGEIGSVELKPLPDAIAGVTAEYTPDVVRLQWEPSGGLIGFILDRTLPPDTPPVDVPTDFVSPFAQPGGGTPPAGDQQTPPGAPVTQSAGATDNPRAAPATPPRGRGGPPAAGGAQPPDAAAPLEEETPGGPQTRYNVYREISPDPLILAGPRRPEWQSERPVPLNTEPLTALTFEDPLTFDGRERCYQVRAVRGSGDAAVEGDPSARICFTPVDTVAPAAPAGLSAEAGPGEISLIWDPNIEQDLAGYVVLRGNPGDATLVPLTASPVPAARYVDRTVTPGIRYIYAVVAVDDRVPVGNVSERSNRVEETAR